MTACRRCGLGIVVSVALALSIGAAATARAQSGTAPFLEPPSRLPAVSPVGYFAQPAPEQTDRVTALEATVADLQKLIQQNADADAKKKAEEEEKKKKGYVVGSDPSMLAKWTNDGATLQSKNADFRYKVRGLCQLDWIGIQSPGTDIISTPGGAGTNDSVTFRRLRFGAEGTMYETIDWVWEFDFAFALQNVDQANAASPSLGLRSFPTGTGLQAGNTINAIQPTPTFMTFKELPVLGNIRVGLQADWFSLEHVESARFLDFMERAPIMDAFSGANNNGYTPGISVFNNTENKRAGLQLGVYKNNVYDSGFTYDVGKSNYTYGGRTIWSPYYDEESNGRYMIHTALGTEYRTFNTSPFPNTDGTNVRLRSRGDLRNTSSTLDPNFADTGNFFTQAQTLLCPELAMVWGPWLFQAEYVASWMNGARTNKTGASLGPVMFNGGYAEALYFLTGENRQYNRQGGFFNRVVPFENAFLTRGAGCHGLGAWQVGLRYDWLDLNSGAVHGGQAQDLTVGLNWFLNPNARFQFNYVSSFINNAAATTAPGTIGSLNGSRFVGDGTISSFGGRMDFNF